MCGVKAMSHCPYLLHKFVINVYSVCFIQVTDCSIRVYKLPTALLEFTRGHSPLPPPQQGCYAYDFDYIQYSSTALLLLVNSCIPHWNNWTTCPTYVFIVWKEDALLPAMFNPLCSSTNQQLFKKNFCNQSSHYENYRQFLLRMKAIMCLP